jgi:hypothetical protein
MVRTLKRLKKVLMFLTLIEEQKIKAMIYCGNGFN